MTQWAPVQFIVQVFREFIRDGCDAMAGTLAFFTLFSLPPLLAVVVDTVALFTGTAKAVGRIDSLVTDLFGPKVATQVLDVLDAVQNTHHDGSGSRVLGIALALFSASVVLAQAQRALNHVWRVDPSRGVEGFLLKRAVGLLLTLGFVAILLLSMGTSASLALIGDRLHEILPEGMAKLPIRILGDVLGFIALGITTTFLHKLLPERQIPTFDAMVGGVVTAALLIGGQVVIAWLVNTIGMGSAYGTAQSLALLLFWVFYGSAIFLWGAEFIKVLGHWLGREIAPTHAEHSLKRLASRARHIRFRRRP